MRTEDIISEISNLPIKKRVEIADQILKTLNRPDPKIDAHWMKIVERRAEEIESGKVDLIPGEEVKEKIKDRFNN